MHLQTCSSVIWLVFFSGVCDLLLFASLWTGLWVFPLVPAEACAPSLAVGDESGSAVGPGPLRRPRGRSRPPAPARLGRGQLSRVTHLTPARLIYYGAPFSSKAAETRISGGRLDPAFMWSSCLFAAPLINGVNDWSVLHQHYSSAFWPCCVCFGSAAIRATVTRLNIVRPPGPVVVFGRDAAIRALDVPPLPITHNYQSSRLFWVFSDGSLFLRDEDERDADLYSRSWGSLC